jgi:ATP-dependent Clp protease protease subunit
MTMEMSAALDHGVDVVGRRIFLHGDVVSGNTSLAIRGMYLMADSSPDPITLFVASYGGSIDEAFALHDVTRTVPVPVHTVALGMCMSAAPFLVACGQKGHRYASENCEFMLHTGSLEMEGSPSNVAGVAEAVRRRGERMDRLFAKYTSKPYRHWAKFSRACNDYFFTAETALEWGLIDCIWSEKD